MWQLEASGLSADISIALTCAAVIALAALVHHIVEKPSLRAIRTWHRARNPLSDTVRPETSRRRWVAAALLVGLAVLAGNRLALTA